MATKKHRAWLLPLVFLAGYMVAWGTIIVDRQMVIASQAELRRQLTHTRQQLQLREMMEDFGSTWQELVIWNKTKKLTPPKEAGNGKVGK